MGSDETTTLGRRALLAAGVGGVAATAVRAIGAPAAVVAADHDPVKLGEMNLATTRTAVRTQQDAAFEGSSGNDDGLIGASAGANKSGVYAYTSNAKGYGVFASNSVTLNGGYLAGPDHGVWGVGHTAGQAAVLGRHAEDGSPGVRGINEVSGCRGELGAGSGVLAFAPAGRMALEVWGAAAFARTGQVAIAAGKQSVKVTGIPLTPQSIAFATLEDYRSGVWIAAAALNRHLGTLTIHLNKKVASPTWACWIVLDRLPGA